MIITKKMLTEQMKRTLLLEKYNTMIEDTFDTDELIRLLEQDYTFRKEIIKSVVKDIRGNDSDNIIYIEHPKHYDDLQLLNSPELEDILETLLYDRMSSGTSGMALSTEKLLDVLKTLDKPIPDKLLKDDFALIGLNTDKLTVHLRNPVAAGTNLFWTLVHEIFHIFPEPDNNENRVETKTFEWLYKYGYTNVIGSKLVVDLITQKYNYEYNILPRIVEVLKDKDYELLMSFLFEAETLFKEILGDNKETEESPEVRGFTSQQVKTYVDTTISEALLYTQALIEELI